MNEHTVSEKAEQVADRIYEDLRFFFQEQLPRERMIRTEVQAVERTAPGEEREVDCRLVLRFHTPANVSLPGDFLVRHMGGNVYGVSVSIGEWEYKDFTVVLPNTGSISPADGIFMDDLRTHVLGELERVTGEHLLREATVHSDGGISEGRVTQPGEYRPLGAQWNGEGVNFALYAERATKVELCLFDPEVPEVETERIVLSEVTAHTWHVYIPGLEPGQLYGYRVYGSYEPEEGLRFNPYKLLIDPYAKAVAGRVDWGAPAFGYKIGHPDADLSYDDRDDAWGKPKSVVVDSSFDWEGDRAPGIPLHRSIIYEVHVKGFTATHPDLPPDLRGTYAGLASPPVIEYLQELGITAVELLPVHTFLDDRHLTEKGLCNYWGYNSINFFSPEARYAAGGDRGEQVDEFKSMVKTLHKAGIEVILDVVYNHTAEGNELGPTLSLKGIENEMYRLVSENKRYYMDYTGTGNTLNAAHPQGLQLIMDSLRYWVEEMHVDGFRFDLASALARELYDVDRLSAFFDVIHQDPVISQVKLIAEPWDVGPGGYQVGNFPVLWSEWNDEYRDTVRAYWRGDAGHMADLGYRLTGSSDLYESTGRKPHASVNFVTAHDGFTLNDLVSYNEKHNEANGENNEDGNDDNISWNHGVEGPTDDRDITEVRERQKRNFLATLLFSHGMPMICGGDEIGRTQQGNNNAYCQDNELSWYDWNLSERQQELLEFARRLVRLRRMHPNLRRRLYPQGLDDIVWYRPDGVEMTEEEWTTSWARTLGMRLSGDMTGEVNERGESVTDDTLLLLLNADNENSFTVPAAEKGNRWTILVDTSRPELPTGQEFVESSGTILLESCSLVLLQQEKVGGWEPVV